MFVNDSLILFDEVGESRVVALAWNDQDGLMIATETTVHKIVMSEAVWKEIVKFFRADDSGPGCYELQVLVEEAGEEARFETVKQWLNSSEDAAMAVERLPQSMECKLTLLSVRRCDEDTTSQ